MAELMIDGSDLVVRLSPLEKLGALHGEVRTALAAVCSVSVTRQPWQQLRGVRAPGIGLPRIIMLGTKQGSFGRDFCALYGNRPAVLVELDNKQIFRRLIVCTRSPEQDLAAIQRHAPQAM